MLDVQGDLMVIDGIIIKGRFIIIPGELQKQALKQLYNNHVGIEKKQGY